MQKGLSCRSRFIRNLDFCQNSGGFGCTSSSCFFKLPAPVFKLCSPAQELEMHKLLMSPQHIPLCPGPTFCREKKQISGNCIFLIIYNCSIFHHPKLNCKANFHTKYQIKLQAVTNHMIYIKPYI